MGGIIMIGALSWIGSRNSDDDNSSVSSPSPVATSSPKGTPAVSPTSLEKPEESKQDRVFERGGFAYQVPDKYRVANDIIALDQKNAPSDVAILTLTRGSIEKEKEYVSLINKLMGDRAATEAPAFLPGQTISVSTTNSASEQSDASLAHSKQAVKTKEGISGTRYRQVEGLFPYDVTYLNLQNGKKIAVQMTYASEEPNFDESAYSFVVNSISEK